MQLLEEQQAENSKILNLLPVKPGLYLFLPNAKKPHFIIPAESKKEFNPALSLIQAKKKIAKLKKIILRILDVKVT